ncbi:9928_t:CDS:2, partial [Entrophospora sp. SA101]
FIKENEVFFPLKFQPSQQATPDGTPCHVHTPVYQITAEKEYSLLVTFLETLITMAWVEMIWNKGKRVTNYSLKDILVKSHGYRQGFCYCE